MAGRLTIGCRVVGDDNRVFVVAELGINHDGLLDRAFSLVDAAAYAGADAVKLQWFKASEMYHYRAGQYSTASGQRVDIYDLMKAMELPKAWVHDLISYSTAKGLLVIPTICDLASLEEAEAYEFPAYKVASYEINHIPLLTALGLTGKQIILSTGGARLGDIEEAVDALELGVTARLAILHCVAQYPTPISNANLGVLTTLMGAFPDAVIGFSDHTMDPVRAPVQAVLLGARIIEKHLTLDRSLPGADHIFALEPPQFRDMVSAIRSAEMASPAQRQALMDSDLIGDSRKTPLEPEQQLRAFAYRSIVATRDIESGEQLTRHNIAVLRSGEAEPGLHPRYYSMLVEGRYRSTRCVQGGRCLQWADILTTQAV